MKHAVSRLVWVCVWTSYSFYNAAGKSEYCVTARVNEICDCIKWLYYAAFLGSVLVISPTLL